MPTPRNPTLSALGNTEMRFSIPPGLLEAFAKEPRIVIKWRPDGIWPIGPELMRHPELLQKLVADKKFNEQFEIVVMPKG